MEPPGRGLVLADHIRAELVVDALQMAAWRRRPPEGQAICHSDQGCQYTSWAFGRRLRAAGVLGSMGSIGDAYDNAMAESFFSTLQRELLDEHRWETRRQLALAVFEWIEGWYDPRRRHSGIGNHSPLTTKPALLPPLLPHDHHNQLVRRTGGSSASSVCTMRRSYLVTGGAGFIGSHLVEALLARGEVVVAFDNLSTGRLRNLDHLGNHPNLRFVQGSVLDELAVDELMHKCDVVVHLAAAVGVKLIVEEPLRSFTTNIRGTETVVESAFRHRRPILLVSTSEIYGKNSAVPLKEEDDRVLGTPTVARWAYSTAKAVDEILAYAYHRERGLPTKVVRLFNTVGPRQSPAYGMVMPRLARQAVANEPLTIYGDGSQTRCFCHVSDVVDALLLLLDNPDAVGGVFNVGSQEEVSILDLAERIMKRSGSESPIRLVPYGEAYPSGFEDMLRRVPAIDRIHALTGWKPTRSLDHIVEEAIAEARAERAVDLLATPKSRT